MQFIIVSLKLNMQVLLIHPLYFTHTKTHIAVLLPEVYLSCKAHLQNALFLVQKDRDQLLSVRGRIWV